MNTFFRSAKIIWMFILWSLGMGLGFGEALKTLKSPHYNVHYPADYEKVAGDVLEVAEAVWPALARAYNSYQNYQTIDIFIADPGDYANGNAIYNFSRVYIYASHINWVMRGRRNWIGNVVTHELAHVFTLRQAAYLSPFDDVSFRAGTINREFNYSLNLSWEPLVAPTWYIEGIAQFEAEEQGYDSWDSQRDLIVRDAFLTGSLPSLGDIETFDGDWVSSERVYNTGFAFLRFLKKKYGLNKLRSLADPKPVFNFTYSAKKVFGKSISGLFNEWKASLAELYSDFKNIPEGKLFVKGGSYTHSLAFSKDGRYVAWIDNKDRWGPVNWIFWKNLKSGEVSKVELNNLETVSHKEQKEEGESFSPIAANMQPSHFKNPLSTNWMQSDFKNKKAENKHAQQSHDYWDGISRSHKFGASGLEFNKSGNRLLTSRPSRQSSQFDLEKSEPYMDLWEYDFRHDKWYRLTWRERASYPSYHPSKNLIVFSKGNGGSSNLAVLLETGKVIQLTNFKEGQQVYNPKYNAAGDSIYFTLGIKDKEAIVSVPANLPGFDPFLALKDSAEFADSMLIAKDYSFNFVTALDSNLDRDIFFNGDTLFWSSYYGDRQYNVFAKVKGDSTLYQVTKVRGQALEPLAHNGKIYYQGYKKQEFNIYEQHLHLEATPYVVQVSDSLPTLREKKLKYESQFEKTEYRGDGIAWYIAPYMSFAPRVVDDTSIISNVGLGLAVATGDLVKYVNQYVEVEVSKELDNKTPMDYSLYYQGVINKNRLRHSRFSWVPQFMYSAYHSVYHSVDEGINETALQDFLGYVLVNSQGAEDPNGDTLKYATEDISQFRQTVNFLDLNTQLPLSFFGGGNYLNIRYTEDYSSEFLYYFADNGFYFPNDSLQTPYEPYKVSMQDQSIYKHMQGYLGWYYGLGKIGTPLPTGFAFQTMLSRYWVNYADSVAEFDSFIEAQCVLEGINCGTIGYSQQSFNPFELNSIVQGMYSFEDKATLRGVIQLASYSQKFPTNYPGLDEPNSSLYPMFYRLGLSRMPGYGYTLRYDGRDILKGTNMFWMSLGADYYLKLHQFFDSEALPFSSLSKIKLSLMGNAGTTLNEAPKTLLKALDQEKHDLLFDLGVRLSFQFLSYHQLPMTLYFQAFMPFNFLDASKFGQYGTNSVSERVEWFNYSSNVGKAILDEVNQPRFFVGLQIGHF